MQNFGLKPNFNMNEIQNKNILMPNFNYNYNFNLGQMKSMDQNKIDLYNSSLSLIDHLQNSYPNNAITSNEIYNIYNMTLKNLKENSKNNKLEDLTKKAHFYFSLYNLINKKKCQHIEKEEYKCSFSSTNLPNQPNNKKIQININNNLFNGAILNNGFYSYGNKNGLLNNNFNNVISGGLGQKLNNNNIYILDDNDKDNENTKSKKVNNNDKNEFVGKKRNLDNKVIDDEKNNKKKKTENNLAKNDKKCKTNNNNKNNNNSIKKKNKKKESPMLEIQKDGLKSTNKSRKNMKKNNQNKINKLNNNWINNNNQKRSPEEAKFSWSNESEKEEEEKFLNFEKDLKDYLRRTISVNRQNIFFSNVLPESLEFIKNLFQKGSDIQINKLYPIYRNNNLELSLIIEPGGKIRKQLLNYDI